MVWSRYFTTDQHEPIVSLNYKIKYILSFYVKLKLNSIIKWKCLFSIKKMVPPLKWNIPKYFPYHLFLCTTVCICVKVCWEYHKAKSPSLGPDNSKPQETHWRKLDHKHGWKYFTLCLRYCTLVLIWFQMFLQQNNIINFMLSFKGWLNWTEQNRITISLVFSS